MFTRNGKGVTAKGIKPICLFQQVFQFSYLFGAFSPITGEHFELEMPCCNTDAFQIFINEFSEVNPEEFKIMLLDNGAFHKAERLIIPKNIHLLFIPPYAPELNPAEKIWWRIKRNFSGKTFKSLSQLSDFISYEVNGLKREEVKTICAYEYFSSYPYWTNI